MPDGKIKIYSKPFAAPKKDGARVFFAAAILVFAAAVFGVAAFSDKLNFSGASSEKVSEANANVIRVPAGGDLQAAVNRARGGDTIELQAGATYAGKINLPIKAGADFITIQSSAASKLPADRRVSPADAGSMAKIVSGKGGEPAIAAENGAHHYRFVGVEFAPAADEKQVYNLVLFGANETRRADVPHDLEIDRCYVHSPKNIRTRRGVALNSSETTIKNSYFEGFAYPQEETQGIGGWTGTRNVRINGNYIEGGAENILFGGSDPAAAELIPSDIEVRGNFLFKPYEWLAEGATLKTLFELKNARRVQFVGNFLENSPVDSAFRITVRNQDGGAPFSTIEDVVIRDNIVTTAARGVNILGRDDTNPSQTLKRLQIVDNIFYKIESNRGNAYFIQIADGEDVTIANNTVFQTGNITTFYGAPPKNFLFRDNIVGHGDYGVHGLDGIKSIAGQKLFQNNVVVNNKNVSAAEISFPPGNNFWVARYADVGFTDLNARNFRLAPTSRFKGKGANKSDIGANVEILFSSVPRELFARLLR